MGESTEFEYKMHDYNEVVTDTTKATLFDTPKGKCWIPNQCIGIVDDEIFTYIETFQIKYLDEDDDFDEFD